MTMEQPHADAAKTTPSLWLERTGKGSFVGRNQRGLTVKIGHAADEFTPGELLQLALAGCTATSSDARFAAALGEDYHSTVGVSANYDQDSDRFTAMTVEVVTDMSELDAQQREQLDRRVRGAVERKCTISHTLNEGISTDLKISGEY